MEALWAPLVYAGLCAMVFVPLEWLFGGEPEAAVGGRATDVGFATVGGVLTHLLVAWVAGGLLALASVVEGPLGAVHPAVSVVLGLGIFELVGYGYHRLAHAVPALRRLHDVHHSAPRMDWLAGFRQHPLEVALVTLAQNLPLVLLGLPIASHITIVMLLRLNTQFVHANLSVPRWIGWFVATPRFHHRHHERTGTVVNYATLFPWLDRLFGTFDDSEATAHGLPGLDDAGLLELLVHPVSAGSAEPR